MNQRECTHHWHRTGMSSRTLMTAGNYIGVGLRCCHCGVEASRQDREVPYVPDGCGPLARLQRIEEGEITVHYRDEASNA